MDFEIFRYFLCERALEGPQAIKSIMQGCLHAGALPRYGPLFILYGFLERKEPNNRIFGGKWLYRVESTGTIFNYSQPRVVVSDVVRSKARCCQVQREAPASPEFNT